METVIDLVRLAKVVSDKRTELNMSLKDLSAITKTSTATLSRIENGKMPDLPTYYRICKWLSVSLDFFVLDELSGHRPSRFVSEVKKNPTAKKSDLKAGDIVVTFNDMVCEVAYSDVLKELVLRDIKPLSEVSGSIWKL